MAKKSGCAAARTDGGAHAWEAIAAAQKRRRASGSKPGPGSGEDWEPSLRVARRELAAVHLPIAGAPPYTPAATWRRSLRRSGGGA